MNTNVSDIDRIVQYESIIDFCDDAIITKSLDGIISSWNNAAQSLFGFTREEIIGKHISVLIPASHLQEESEIISNIKNGKQVQHYETERLRKDGSTVFISLTVSPIKDKNGVVIGASKIARDITRQKREEEQRRLLESVVTHTRDAVLITESGELDDPGPRILYVNEAFSKMTGYRQDEVIGKTPRILQGPKSDLSELKRLSEAMRKNEHCEITIINYKKDGSQFWNEFSVNPIIDPHGNCTHFVAIERDVTQRKNAELKQLLLSKISVVFSRYMQLGTCLDKVLHMMANFGNFGLAEVWLIGAARKKIILSGKGFQANGNEALFNKKDAIVSFLKGEGLPGITWSTGEPQYWHQIDEQDAFVRHETAKKAGLKSAHGFPLIYNNEIIGVLVLAANTSEVPGADFSLLLKSISSHLAMEIGRKQAEQARKKAEMASIKALRERNTILESIDDGFFAVDRKWTVTYWNGAAEKLLGLPKDDILERNLWEVYGHSVNTESYNRYVSAMNTNQAARFEDFSQQMSKWYDISAYPSESGMSVYFKDITVRKTIETKLNELNENLLKQAKALSISNSELEQFAYVASHDLQEPLRMVTSFLSQLEKKYGQSLDDKAKKYIFFAVDGAKRMRQIILDLLEFSRVGRTDDQAEQVDLNFIIDDILALFRKQIDETHAAISYSGLPTLQVRKAPVRQVFQNLVGNGLKYMEKSVRPVISISCEDNGAFWLFSVKDNGIGIDPAYFDKIFIIFQRLHNKEDYSGTGMGLAITKKIVENMGGAIWVTSEEGNGSTFSFTIPK